MKQPTSTKRVKGKVRKVKRGRFYGLMIFRTGWNTPWTKEIFKSEEYAKAYFDSYCDFEWRDYDLVKCTISYQVPLPTTKSKK